MTDKIEITAPIDESARKIFTPEAMAFLADIASRFSDRRDKLLQNRQVQQAEFDSGQSPNFFEETRSIRESKWQVAPPPSALEDRRVEITGPVDRKMLINALNSSARVFMADCEDSLSPTWARVAAGQVNLYDAVRGECEFIDPASGKHYALNPNHECQLIVRPRGWHLPEKHLIFRGKPVAASLVDFALFFFHGAKILHQKNRGPFFYLPKVEHWEEASLWDDVIAFAESQLDIPRETTKVTLLIETLPAVFQMHEILHAMRGRIVGLNCGRWDYIFSYIKTFRADPSRVLPDRNAVGMTQPFLRAYSRLLIQTCHRRGAHAMGGMAAFIPIRADEEANAAALNKVREDKMREAQDGHDGTWVAHPDLIKTAMEVFNKQMPSANQKDAFPSQEISADDLIATPLGDITAEGLDNNIQVALRYISAWLGGGGAVPIFNLMEDAATAEIARSQLWQWVRYPKGVLQSGENITREMFLSRLAFARDSIAKEWDDASGGGGAAAEHLNSATELLEDFVLADSLADFLTLSAYEKLD